MSHNSSLSCCYHYLGVFSLLLYFNCIHTLYTSITVTTSTRNEMTIFDTKRSITSFIIGSIISTVLLLILPDVELDVINWLRMTPCVSLGVLLLYNLTTDVTAPGSGTSNVHTKLYFIWHAVGAIALLMTYVVHDDQHLKIQHDKDAAQQHITDTADEVKHDYIPYCIMYAIYDMYIVSNVVMAVAVVAQLVLMSNDKAYTNTRAADRKTSVLSHRASTASSASYRDQVRYSVQPQLQNRPAFANTCAVVAIALGVLRVIVFYRGAVWGAGTVDDLRFMLFMPLTLLLRSSRIATLNTKKRLCIMLMLTSVLALLASLTAIRSVHLAAKTNALQSSGPSYGRALFDLFLVVISLPSHVIFAASLWTGHKASNFRWLLIIPGDVLALLLTSFFTTRFLGLLGGAYAALQFIALNDRHSK